MVFLLAYCGEKFQREANIHFIKPVKGDKPKKENNNEFFTDADPVDNAS
jgi:hypothetical protein